MILHNEAERPGIAPRLIVQLFRDIDSAVMKEQHV